MRQAQDSPMLKAAIGYAKQGTPVFPIKPRDKRPLTGSGFKDATTDENTITTWWSRWPEANIGVPTGEVSGWLVFDIDADKGGFESLKTLEAKYGQLPQTLEVMTGGGGVHKVFSYPKGKDYRNSAGKLGAGLDIRGNGGYVVAPPSVHASGRRYKRSSNSAAQPVAAPEWFLGLLKTQNGKAGKRERADGPAMAHSSLLKLCRGVREGQRNDAMARLAGGLLRFQRGYLDPDLVLELLFAWNEARCRPPLSRHEVLQVVDSIAGAEINKVKMRSAKNDEYR